MVVCLLVIPVFSTDTLSLRLSHSLDTVQAKIVFAGKNSFCRQKPNPGMDFVYHNVIMSLTVAHIPWGLSSLRDAGGVNFWYTETC